MNKNDIEKTRVILEEQKQDFLESVKKIKEKESDYLGNGVGDDVDKASDDYQREILFYLSDHDRNRLDAIEDALLKIDEGRFGICENCTKKISNDRLKARPYARLCIKCKPAIENNS